MGRFLREEPTRPTSSCALTRSARAKRSICYLPELGAKPQVQFLHELYLAEPELILAVIRGVTDKDWRSDGRRPQSRA